MTQPHALDTSNGSRWTLRDALRRLHFAPRTSPSSTSSMTDVVRLWYVYAMAATIMAVGAVALMGALTWYGRPIPSVLFSPEMVASNLSMPSWIEHRQGIAFPDRVTSVDGIEIQARSGRGAFDNAIAQAVQQGRDAVRVEVRTAAATRSVLLPIIPFPALAWWWFVGGLSIAGVVYVAAAVLAVLANPNGKLARSFFAFATLTALFAFTYFDLLTTQRLVPCFYVAFAMLPSALITLSLHLPTDAWLLRRAPWSETVVWVVGALLALALVSSHGVGLSTVLLRQVAWGWLDVSLVWFVVVLVIRFLRADAADRAVLRPLALWLTPGVAVLAWYVASKMGLTGWNASSSLVPALALVPIAPLGACAHHDLRNGRSILPGALRRLALWTATAITTVSLGTTVASLLGVPPQHALVAAIFTALVAGGIALATTGSRARRQAQWQDERHVLFERLTEQLTHASTREEVISVIERTVRHEVACEEVTFIASSKDAAQAPTSNETRTNPRLSIRSLLHGCPAGTLRVTKEQDSSFSIEEVALLRTIANHATLASALVDRVTALDERRRQQAEAWEGERAAIIEALAAEIAHEVRYPINFFRSIFSRGSGQHHLDEEDVDIGCEEVERLERLVTDLRKVAVRRLERREVRMIEIIARAEALLRDRLDGRSFRQSVPRDIRVRCDPDQITQVLVNLMANAVSATKNGEELGIDWVPMSSGANLVVWDRGAGFVCPPSVIFTPWFTTKSTGTGLGLAITHRIVRAHGWAVDPERKNDRTFFSIFIPASDVVAEVETSEVQSNELEMNSNESEEAP